MRNETKKRLEIIALALSLDDIETIDLQMIKLQALEIDYHIKSIIFLLDTQNYLDAKQHIDEYITTSTTSIEQSSDDNTILQNDSTTMPEPYLMSPKQTIEETEENIAIDEQAIQSDQTNGFNLHEIIPKDDFFDTIEKNTMDNNNDSDIDNASPLYQNFKHLQDVYMPIVPLEHTSDKIKEWLSTLSSDQHSEATIETLLKESKALEETNKAEAAQLLLLAASTSSHYAQFILARALYKGSLLERDLDVSFKIMSQLAYKEKYPEAICDLAQFYENGVSVDIDTLQAETLYKEAVELGIQRAEKHYNRLQKESEGFFSFLKGS